MRIEPKTSCILPKSFTTRLNLMTFMYTQLKYNLRVQFVRIDSLMSKLIQF
jgi:hypothetical protein